MNTELVPAPGQQREGFCRSGPCSRAGSTSQEPRQALPYPARGSAWHRWLLPGCPCPHGATLQRDRPEGERRLSPRRRFKPALLTEPALRQSSEPPAEPSRPPRPSSSVDLCGGTTSTTAPTLGPTAAALTDFTAPGVQGGHHVLLGGHDEFLRALRGLQGGELELPHVLLPPARGNGSAGEMGPGRERRGACPREREPNPAGPPELTSRICPLGPHRRRRPKAAGPGAAAAAPAAPPP